jgi:DNA-binding transcriptional LysR family regulator
VTPAQLRAFSAVVRLGSVKAAAAELGVTEAAVSLHVGQLRKELEDQLFTRTASGLAFTPGGLRLATRATEMLGLQDRTIIEVSQAGRGRRLLRVAASSQFAEHAAPGLIELFAGRADDLDVELSVCSPAEFESLLASRAVDVAIGPKPRYLPDSLDHKPFLNYQVVTVAGREHPLAGASVGLAQLRQEIWLLGPSAAAGDDGVVPHLLRQLDIPEDRQRIFQSEAAALEETKRHKGLALALSFALADDIAKGSLVRVSGHGLQASGVWSAMSLPAHSVLPAASELLRFITTPRATQAMLRGSGVTIGHFRPSVHVTLWK